MGLRVLTPAVILVLITGIVMVGTDSAEFSFSQLWVRIAFGAFAAAFLVGAVYLSRAAIQMDRSASSGDLRAAVNQLGRWLVGYAVVLAILGVSVWDMIFKPGT